MTVDRATQAALDAQIPAVLHDDWCRPYIPDSGQCYCTARERLYWAIRQGARLTAEADPAGETAPHDTPHPG